MLKRLEVAGFKSFARKTVLDFSSSVTAIVGPNGSGKSNVAEAFRFALGEQSMKSMRGKRSEDLIFSGSHSAPRANRASVTIVFDNSKKQFKLDFDEVAFERAVFRDGSSEYAINGSKARLRDIQELIAGASIGDTGHHIISQGEADRILLANPRERREMLEDALGLAAYEYRKEESRRKLEKTEENMRQVGAMRRELTPHLKFLTSQVEKLEKADGMRAELAQLWKTYDAVETAYLKTEKEGAVRRKEEARARIKETAAMLGTGEGLSEHDREGLKKSDEVRRAERELDRAMSERSALSREIGKAEGALESAKRRSADASRDPYARVPRADLEALRDEIEQQAGMGGATAESLAAALHAIRTAVRAFFERFALPGEAYLADEEQTVFRLQAEYDALGTKDTDLSKKEEEARAAVGRAREALTAYEEANRESRHKLIEVAEEKARRESEVVREEDRERELALLSEEHDRMRAEIAALIGSLILSGEAAAIPHGEERSVQEGRRKAASRLMIRLEEAGGTGEDVRTEHKEATEREAFLAREIEDLSKSAAGLRDLIRDLDVELAKSFDEGLKKVNDSFGEFFSLMFGGGGAKLVLEEFDAHEEDDEESFEGEEEKQKEARKPGIEISVHLPKKRVQSLMQLSGGERALTSIALIFAMSQVNPPPFLILDETDAALDEANSRRYGDMIENLAKKSQLIVITHNRETMSRAGILYGVTIGADGISKLLSVKFDEALSVAK